MNYIIQRFTVTSDNNTGEINEASLFLSLSRQPVSIRVSQNESLGGSSVHLPFCLLFAISFVPLFSFNCPSAVCENLEMKGSALMSFERTYVHKS